MVRRGFRCLSLWRWGVGVGAAVPGGEPLLELGGVRVPLEGRDACRIEPKLGRATLHGGAIARRRHSPIVSRRQRAKRITSSIGGTAASSPHAVNMRQRPYLGGGSG